MKKTSNIPRKDFDWTSVEAQGPGEGTKRTTLPLPTVQQAYERGRLNWDQFKWTHNTHTGSNVKSILESGEIYGEGDYGSGGYLAAGTRGYDEYGMRRIDVSIRPSDARFGGVDDALYEDVHFPLVEPDDTFNRKRKHPLGEMAIIREGGEGAIKSMRETTFKNESETNDVLGRIASEGDWEYNQDITDDMWGRWGESSGYDRDEFIEHVNRHKRLNRTMQLDQYGNPYI